MNTTWTDGNRARLLENGEEFFPAVFDAVRAAREAVIIETFILWEDKVGQALAQVLIEAAGRGVAVDLMIDGFGSAELSDGFVDSMMRAGVRVRTFDAAARSSLFSMRMTRKLKVLRRMHRKLVVIDGRLAFVGGINYSGDHLMDFGPMAKQDYAVELEGPVVDQIHQFALAAIGRASPPSRLRWRPRARTRTRGRAQAPMQTSQADGPAHAVERYDIRALFVTRDNVEHHNDIERQYRLALRGARKRVLIANAYFFPGYRVLRQLVQAARRGVDVRLVLQGEPDMPIVKYAASLLYSHLLRHGVRIHEYCKRPLHGKVAVIDDDWSTVGSSNLDPLSLSLNLEANVILRDAAFARELAQRLETLIEQQCKEIEPLPPSRWAWWESLRSTVVFHVLRRFPAWAARLPRHAPTLDLRAPTAAAVDDGTAGR
ncbi:MAG TPA: cardiolipin synthase ClsB [Burkholderiaceae bacterium]|nr:cardiolipin synthase ClsB [Burkholderiaceae bacterium]